MVVPDRLLFATPDRAAVEHPGVYPALTI